MPAYAIFTLHKLYDADKMSAYRRHAKHSLDKYGAIPRVVRGKQTVLEGDDGIAMVMLEFESYDKAMAWYHSPEYQESKKIREGAGDITTVIVEGFEA